MAVEPPTPIPERASMAERDATIRRLREGCESERLSLDTFAERIETAYQARSRAQLAELVADLPARSRAARLPSALVSLLSRWAAHLAAAWREPRIPRLILPIEGVLTLGRSRASGCVLNDPTVSRRHAKLRCHDGSWWLSDLRSTNGTLVNGYRVVEEVAVCPGDSVTFGAVTYRLASPRPRSPAAVAQ